MPVCDVKINNYIWKKVPNFLQLVLNRILEFLMKIDIDKIVNFLSHVFLGKMILKCCFFRYEKSFYCCWSAVFRIKNTFRANKFFFCLFGVPNVVLRVYKCAKANCGKIKLDFCLPEMTKTHIWCECCKSAQNS